MRDRAGLKWRVALTVHGDVFAGVLIGKEEHLKIDSMRNVRKQR
jgi:hypothetical protein